MEGLIFAGVFLAMLVGQYVYVEYRHNKMLNRLMSRNYEEYKYYQEKYPRDLKEVDRLRQESKQGDRKEVELQFHDPNTEKLLAKFEEEWGADEVDEEKLKELDLQEMEMVSNDMEKDNSKDT